MNTSPSPANKQSIFATAKRWEIASIIFTTCTIALVALVMSGSQAVKTAWIEDMLSLMPPIAFLIASVFLRKPATPRHPFGFHRVMGLGHFIAGCALFAVGSLLAIQAVATFFETEHPKIENVTILGVELWQGWLMIAVMSLIVIGPLFFFGPAKSRLAPQLHNKLLLADADMAKADWQTNAASIVGVLGIGIGWWWLDAVAALFISVGIVIDGFRNIRGSLDDVIDRQARTTNDEHAHSLFAHIGKACEDSNWVRSYGLRIRDLGEKFHAEVFVVSKQDSVTLEQLRQLRLVIQQIDDTLFDVVISPVDAVPKTSFTAADIDSVTSPDEVAVGDQRRHDDR